MTYLEDITFLTGNFIQVSQFTLKNAYRLVILTDAKNNQSHYFSHSSELLETLEVKASEMMKERGMSSSSILLPYFKENEGLSKKDLSILETMLKNRDFLLNDFFISNSNSFAREDANIYEAKIKQLNNWIDEASKLNVSLSKACDHLYDSL